MHRTEAVTEPPLLPLLMAPALQPWDLSWELGGFREFAPAAGESLRALERKLCLRNELSKRNQEWFRLFHSW